MLRKLSDKVADCYGFARDAREKAECAPDADKLELLAVERRWLMLAESYELVERLSDFKRGADRRVAALFAPQGEPASAPCPSCGKDMQRMQINPPGTNACGARTPFACQACGLAALHAGRTID